MPMSAQTWTGELREGETDQVRVQLEEGVAYQFAGSCDRNCPNLHIFIEFPPSRAILADAQGIDPTVVFAPEQTGEYRVTIVMRECANELCNWSLEVSIATRPPNP